MIEGDYQRLPYWTGSLCWSNSNGPESTSNLSNYCLSTVNAILWSPNKHGRSGWKTELRPHQFGKRRVDNRRQSQRHLHRSSMQSSPRLATKVVSSPLAQYIQEITSLRKQAFLSCLLQQLLEESIQQRGWSSLAHVDGSSEDPWTQKRSQS